MLEPLPFPQHQIRWNRRRGIPLDDPRGMTITIATAGAGGHAAAATTDTDHGALPTTAGADVQRVLESEFVSQIVARSRFSLKQEITSFLSLALVDECMREEEPGAARTTGRPPTLMTWSRALCWAAQRNADKRSLGQTEGRSRQSINLCCRINKRLSVCRWS